MYWGCERKMSRTDLCIIFRETYTVIVPTCSVINHIFLVLLFSLKMTLNLWHVYNDF